MELEGEDADDGEEREEVSEDGDDLRVPEAAQHGDAEDFAHAERFGRRGRGGGGFEDLFGDVLCGFIHRVRLPGLAAWRSAWLA